MRAHYLRKQGISFFVKAKTTPNRCVYLPWLVTLYVFLGIAAGVCEPRQVCVFGLNTSSGSIAFPLTYVLADVITEVYGYRYARRTIFLGLFFYVVYVTYGWLVAAAMSTADPLYTSFQAFSAIDIDILLGASVNVLITENLNAYGVFKMKQWTRGRWMGIRFLLTTVFAYAIDELLYAPLAFHRLLSWTDLKTHMFDSWLFMVCVELMVLPLSVRLAKALQKRELYYAKTQAAFFQDA